MTRRLGICFGTGLTTVALLAGCSSESAPSPEPSTSQAPSGHGTFAECLSAHDVAAPPGPVAGPPPGVDAAKWKTAMDDCSTLAPGPAG
jgi:hypothetical protein